MKVIIAALFAIFLLPLAANAERLACPKGSSGLTLFDGNPKEQVALKPDNGDQQAEKHTYTLDKNNKRGYWIHCQYPGAEKPLEHRFKKKSFSSCTSFIKKEQHVISCK